MIYGTQWSASNHPVYLLERSGTCDALLHVSHTLQSALESGQEARIVQIDFSAAFSRVNLLGILYKLFSVGIGGLSCLYRHSFYQTDHSKLWWMVV